MVGLKDLMEDRDYAYIVLELCKGPDLEAVLEVRGKFAPAPSRRPSKAGCLLRLDARARALMAGLVAGTGAVPGARGCGGGLRDAQGHLHLPHKQHGARRHQAEQPHAASGAPGVVRTEGLCFWSACVSSRTLACLLQQSLSAQVCEFCSGGCGAGVLCLCRCGMKHPEAGFGQAAGAHKRRRTADERDCACLLRAEPRRPADSNRERLGGGRLAEGDRFWLHPGRHSAAARAAHRHARLHGA